MQLAKQIERLKGRMMVERCRECEIVLSEFEKEEYSGLCIDCWREAREQQE